MFKVGLLALFTHSLAACINAEKDEPAGSPCTYETKIYSATVIAIKKTDSLNGDILFRVNDASGQLYRDSVSWYIENKNYMELTRIQKDSVAVGKKYKYTVDRIKTGSCNPHIERLLLEKI